AATVGVKRMVVVSSNSPIGCNPTPTHRFDEASPYNPYMGYGRSKMRMEQNLHAAMNLSGYPELVVVRPPWFYGPEQPARQTLFFRMIKNGKFPLLGTGENQRSLGYVDSLAYGILLAASTPHAAGQTYWLADEVPYPMHTIISTVAQVLREDFGLPVAAKTLHLPAMVGDVAQLIDGTLQAVGLYHQKFHVLSEMNKTIACSITKAKTDLGYTPLCTLRDGMRNSIDWCLKNGQTI
ncbi:MAG: NAD-dependent epimerase/dehydratase family protein, partial [Alphaproteobacteria bacterium]